MELANRVRETFARCTAEDLARNKNYPGHANQNDYQEALLTLDTTDRPSTAFYRLHAEDGQKKETANVSSSSSSSSSSRRTQSDDETFLKLMFKVENTQCTTVVDLLQKRGFERTCGHQWALYWSGSPVQDHVYKRLHMFQKVNHFPGSSELTRKDRLCANLTALQRMYGKANVDIIPETFILPEQYSAFKKAYHNFSSESSSGSLWIAKPCASSRGRGITILDARRRFQAVPSPEERCIVQRYIPDPYLINGLKFDLRLYVLVTSFSPLSVYVFKDGLVRFASAPFDAADLENQIKHLTNYSINKNAEGYDPTEHKWSLGTLNVYLKEQGEDVEALWGRILNLINLSLFSVDHIIKQRTDELCAYNNCCFELFGFDILLDSKLKPWLLEVNLSPSLAIESPLDKKIKTRLICETLNVVGLPKLTKQELSRAQERARIDALKQAPSRLKQDEAERERKETEIKRQIDEKRQAARANARNREERRAELGLRVHDNTISPRLLPSRNQNLISPRRLTSTLPPPAMSLGSPRLAQSTSANPDNSETLSAHRSQPAWVPKPGKTTMENRPPWSHSIRDAGSPKPRKIVAGQVVGSNGISPQNHSNNINPRDQHTERMEEGVAVQEEESTMVQQEDAYVPAMPGGERRPSAFAQRFSLPSDDTSLSLEPPSPRELEEFCRERLQIDLSTLLQASREEAKKALEAGVTYRGPSPARLPTACLIETQPLFPQETVPEEEETGMALCLRDKTLQWHSGMKAKMKKVKRNPRLVDRLREFKRAEPGFCRAFPTNGSARRFSNFLCDACPQTESVLHTLYLDPPLLDDQPPKLRCPLPLHTNQVIERAVEGPKPAAETRNLQITPTPPTATLPTVRTLPMQHPHPCTGPFPFPFFPNARRQQLCPKPHNQILPPNFPPQPSLPHASTHAHFPTQLKVPHPRAHPQAQPTAGHTTTQNPKSHVRPQLPQQSAGLMLPPSHNLQNVGSRPHPPSPIPEAPPTSTQKRDHEPPIQLHPTSGGHAVPVAATERQENRGLGPHHLPVPNRPVPSVSVCQHEPEPPNTDQSRAPLTQVHPPTTNRHPPDMHRLMQAPPPSARLAVPGAFLNQGHGPPHQPMPNGMPPPHHKMQMCFPHHQLPLHHHQPPHASSSSTYTFPPPLAPVGSAARTGVPTNVATGAIGLQMHSRGGVPHQRAPTAYHHHQTVKACSAGSGVVLPPASAVAAGNGQGFHPHQIGYCARALPAHHPQPQPAKLFGGIQQVHMRYWGL